jgi:putative effector of murein hydrolase LrgA (UPF0299 family)
MRSTIGVAVIGAAWGAGELVEQAVGSLPGPVVGLVLLAAVLLLRPGLDEVVAPVAALLVRALPLLFVPAVVAVAAVRGEVDVVAAVLAVAVSVPVGFVVAARLAR